LRPISCDIEVCRAIKDAWMEGSREWAGGLTSMDGVLLEDTARVEGFGLSSRSSSAAAASSSKEEVLKKRSRRWALGGFQSYGS